VTSYEIVEMEHPDYGVARVLCRWEAVGDAFRWVPFAVEFDLFTPIEAQEALTADLKCVRLTGTLA